MIKIFDFDWFSRNIPSFEKHLAHLRGIPCRALEIGTHEGRSATWMLENILTHPEARIDCIDIQVKDHLWHNLKAAGGLQKVAFHRADPSRRCMYYRSVPSISSISTAHIRR